MTLTELTLASLPFAWFMAVSSITPGPNNLMLAASGMNYGFKRTIPHMLGVAFGFGFLVFLCAFGIGAVYHTYPSLRMFLNAFAAVYMLYLAYKIATSGRPEFSGDEGKRPMNFIEASLFQFVNPKGWVMALASASAFLPPEASLLQQSLVILVMVFAINFPCVGVWTSVRHRHGETLRLRTRAPHHQHHARRFADSHHSHDDGTLRP
jgi:threonine/homoserine/homoserine lactone efflux protein